MQRQHSSVVEQLIRNEQVLGSSPSAGSSSQAAFCDLEAAFLCRPSIEKSGIWIDKY